MTRSSITDLINTKYKESLTKYIREALPYIESYFGKHNVDLVLDMSKLINYCENYDECILHSIIPQYTGCIGHVLIRIPEDVIIRNATGKSHTLKGVYIKLPFTAYLFYKFYICRSTYTYEEYKAKYIHSHVPALRYEDNGDYFNTPCTGLGPISDTLTYLNESFSEHLMLLYLDQIMQWLRVESISGGPYIPISHIKYGDVIIQNEVPIIYTINRESLVYEYINSKQTIIPLTYNNGKYTLSAPFHSIIPALSNWARSICPSIPCFKYLIDNTGIYSFTLIENNALNVHIESVNNIRKLFSFKGEDVKLHIIKNSINNCTIIELFNVNTLILLTETYLNIINKYYGTDKIINIKALQN